MTPEGLAEAEEAGKLMLDREMGFDIAFTSMLSRAQDTCYATLEAMNLESKVPVVQAWQLNERHYGFLQGRAKDDPALIKEYGEDQLLSWRRDFNVAPPAMEANHPYFQHPPAPLTGRSLFTSNVVLRFRPTLRLKY